MLKHLPGDLVDSAGLVIAAFMDSESFSGGRRKWLLELMEIPVSNNPMVIHIASALDGDAEALAGLPIELRSIITQWSNPDALLAKGAPDADGRQVGGE